MASFNGVNIFGNVEAKAPWPAVVSDLYTVKAEGCSTFVAFSVT